MTTQTSQDLNELISLLQIAEFLNGHFYLSEQAARVSTRLPLSWWKRSRAGYGIAVPMPEPSAYYGKNKSPMWTKRQIRDWFRRWHEGGVLDLKATKKSPAIKEAP